VVTLEKLSQPKGETALAFKKTLETKKHDDDYHTKVVDVQMLIDEHEKELDILVKQKEATIAALRKSFNKVPLSEVFKQQKDNETLREPKTTARLFVEGIRLAIVDLLDKGYITKRDLKKS